MKKLSKSMLSMLMIAILAFGCDLGGNEDEAPASASEMIKGTWTISSMNLFGVNIPGDGSSLTFGDCVDGVCTGQDYEAEGGTTGTFTYELTENDTKVVIVDEDQNGGNYNTTWEIIDLQNSKLKMSGDFSIFGSMLLDMNK